MVWGSESWFDGGKRLGRLKTYVNAQFRLYEETCTGWFFWTFRKQDSEEGDSRWSFREAVMTGSFPETL
jgi:glucan 1,3-beta-glucosidase